MFSNIGSQRLQWKGYLRVYFEWLLRVFHCFYYYTLNNSELPSAAAL